MCRPYGTRVIDLSLPGTTVPGYRLFRPRSTSSGQALRDWFVVASTDGFYRKEPGYVWDPQQA